MRNDFDTASVLLLQEAVERLRTMEQRQIRMETRLCRFIQSEGKGEVLHPTPTPNLATTD